MYTIRFHLGAGPHKGHWQIRKGKDLSGEVVAYHDPKAVSLILTGCRLRNQKGTAKKIKEGAEKTPCAWIECETYAINSALKASAKNILKYNPRVCASWQDAEGNDVDNKKISTIITVGMQPYAL